MDGILQLLRRVAAFVLLSACVDFLMPDGNWRAYVRFASGLILLQAVLGPLWQWMSEVLR
ncbi:MAG TPA: stage III sporulation protein AF [Candidatus Aphodomonas merdavium]|nr:stage III sporulation protein AF [Candidatus Aphodomonas merdavium]